jgi:hypothetical protein
VTRGRREYPDDEQGDRLNEERERLQRDLLGLSRDSEQMIAARSGHHIQLEDPETVVAPIRQILRRSR